MLDYWVLSSPKTAKAPARKFYYTVCIPLLISIEEIIDKAPVHTANTWFNDHGTTVLYGPTNSLELNAAKKSMAFYQEEDEKQSRRAEGC